MLTKASTNDDGQQHTIIGDILLHSESKITIVQVITHLITTTASSLTPDKPVIHRLLPNSSGTTTSQTVVPCDLKNALPIKVTNEKTKSTSSSKKLLRMQKAGVALVKEFKSKVVTSNQTESKVSTNHTNIEDEGTHF